MYGLKKLAKCTKFQAEDFGAESVMGGPMEKLCMSHGNCSFENALTYLELRGQEKRLFSTHLTSMRKPFPSHSRPLMRLDFLPQKRKIMSGTKRDRWERGSNDDGQTVDAKAHIRADADDVDDFEG